MLGTGSHQTLNSLFESAGAPGDPPDLSHEHKWKHWLFRTGQDPNADSLAVLGGVLEEFMDVNPKSDSEEFEHWTEKRAEIEEALANNGLRYYRFGRVLPQDSPNPPASGSDAKVHSQAPARPDKVEELIEIIIRGMPRAIHPLAYRRKGLQSLLFANEYDVQDLLHAMLRAWIGDIRPEEFTPSYAGTSTRMDFLLPEYSLVIETKIVRDRRHAKRIGDELIIDIEHYQSHQACKRLWGVVYDPEKFITNSDGLQNDLEGLHSTKHGEISVRIFIL